MITMLIVPLMVNSIDEYNNQAEWRLIFIITACVLVGTNIVFIVFGSAQPAYWTEEEFLCKQISKTAEAQILALRLLVAYISRLLMR
jgi:hypothetical protein